MKFVIIFLVLLVPTIASSQTILATTTTCTQATINAGTAGCAIFNANGLGSVGIQITGTWTGTITFSTSVLTGGVGATFVTSLVTPVGATTPVSTTTGNGAWSLTVAGFSQVKVAVTSAGSGSAIVTIRGVQQARGSGGGSSGGGGGTVTSVGLSAPDILTVSGSPVTTTGTLAFTPTDPNADRIVFWDDSAGKWVYLTVGTNLSITGTTLDAAGGSPGGMDTYVQYNDSGAFGGEAGLTWDETNNNLTITITGSTDTYGLKLFNTTFSSMAYASLTPNTDGAVSLYAADSTFLILADGFAYTEDIETTGLNVDATGVRLNSDDDGALTFSGLGNGFDEDLTFNFDDVANTIGVTSSTGVTTVDFGSIILSGAFLSADIIAAWTGTCDATSVLGADGICAVISSGFDIIESGTNTTAAMVVGSGASLTIESNIDIGAAGVRLTGDGDGALTFLGLGNGSDENLTFNFDDVSNTVVVSSSTGVDEIQLTNPIELITFTGNGEIEALGSGDLRLSADGDDIFLGTGNTSIELYDGTGNINVLQGATNVFQFKSMGGVKVEFDYGSNANNFYLSTTSFNGVGSFYVAGIITADNGIIVGGSTPSVANVGMDSCGTSAASITGNSNSGRVTVGATSGTQCRVTTTITAPNGWQCSVSNTVTANLARCVGVDTTHFDLVGVFVAADVLSYVALPN